MFNEILGLDQNDLGQFVEEVMNREFDAKGKTRPDFIKRGSVAKRFDIFDTRYLDGKSNMLLTSANSKDFAANHPFKTGNDEMFILVGLRLDESAGLADAACHTLDFDTIADTKLRNGKLSFSANGIKEIDEQEINHLFTNTGDAVNYHRFNSPILLDINQKVEATISAEVAPALWSRIHVYGLRITTKTSD